MQTIAAKNASLFTVNPHVRLMAHTRSRGAAQICAPEVADAKIDTPEQCRAEKKRRGLIYAPFSPQSSANRGEARAANHRLRLSGQQTMFICPASSQPTRNHSLTLRSAITYLHRPQTALRTKRGDRLNSFDVCFQFRNRFAC